MLQFIAHILFYDVWFYLSHLALHTAILYPIHAIHHEKRQPMWPDTYHGHWAESVFQGVGCVVPFAVLPLWSWTEAIAALLVINTRGMLRHDPRGSWLVGHHHLLHHTKFRVNYGEPWLDWIGGTLYSSAKPVPEIENGTYSVKQQALTRPKFDDFHQVDDARITSYSLRYYVNPSGGQLPDEFSGGCYYPDSEVGGELGGRPVAHGCGVGPEGHQPHGQPRALRHGAL